MAVTIREVARLAGASTAAVSATLNGSRGSNIRVGTATQSRIKAAAQQLGYRSNPVARSLVTGRSQVIGLMLPYVEGFSDDNPFCALVTSGVIRETIQLHYNLMLYTSMQGTNFHHSHGDHLPKVDGVVLVMPPSSSEILLHCETKGIPYVSIIREPIPGTMTVNSDDVDGAMLATRHLIELGHTRIAHLLGDPDAYTTTQRLAGYTRALAAAKLPFDETLVRQASFDWRASYSATRNLIELPKSKRPTAIFASNDLAAEGAMRAIRESGRQVPHDVAVVGYDDTWFATTTQPQLTSVRMPIAEMGASAVRLLIAAIEGTEISTRHVVEPVSLSIRESCGTNHQQIPDPRQRGSASCTHNP
ncbi:MAG: LacI family DNA-binding transcriptional regulator [Armatimonadetes bacterium]|nr:LacI family DNA-binding transcriptional regulator [Armatimonadota bacterium]